MEIVGKKLLNNFVGRDADEGGGGDIINFNNAAAFGLLQEILTKDGAIGEMFSLVEQLKKAGFKDPAKDKAKYIDKDILLQNVPALVELFKITEASFIENLNINSPAVTHGQIVEININNIGNILSYAFTLGHEMYGHVFANRFFKSKFSEITRISETSTRNFNFFQEVMGVQWEMSMGATRYGNNTAFEATSLYYGPQGVGHEQSVIDRVNSNIGRLMYEWRIMYNIQKNKSK
ncbi:hypothetical protein [Chryseobacterium sp. SIMBA_038]|uniref:hypothetical protein n=1 Tax=Chryseobacterium sp. SIMBA_038 TaxID=3085780 RepID=UPI0039795964